MSSKGISALLVVAALWSTPARASEVFPGALQEAADMQCVPVCLMCHTTNPGTASSWQQKPLGPALFGAGARKGDAESLKKAYQAYAAIPANAGAVSDIKAGREPGLHVDVCGPTYGCGAHVAKTVPSSDVSAPLWVIGAMIAGSILRRRRKTHVG
mgnify:CR=1 FL=1